MPKKIKCTVQSVTRKGEGAVLMVLLSEGATSVSRELHLPAATTVAEATARIQEMAGQFANRDDWFLKLQDLHKNDIDIEVPDVQEPE